MKPLGNFTAVTGFRYRVFYPRFHQGFLQKDILGFSFQKGTIYGLLSAAQLVEVEVEVISKGGKGGEGDGDGGGKDECGGRVGQDERYLCSGFCISTLTSN